METETEIIKTDDPNIVKEVLTREINITGLPIYREGMVETLTTLQSKVNKLKSYKNLPATVQEVVNREVAELQGEIFSCEQEIIRVDKILL